MESKKKIIIQAIICVGLLSVIWGVYFLVLEKLNQRIEFVQEDDFSWVVQVDKVRTEEDEFILEGFAFKLGQNTEEKSFDIVLHNLDTGEYLFPKMKYGDRKDVNDYFLCEYDYTKSGFTAKIKKSKLNLEKNDFEVLLLPEWSHKPYQFATYLADGELMYANPKEYVSLDVEGTDLEEIVDKGVLRVYEPENRMYVYQYAGELYWIAEEDYEFEEDKSTYMQYAMETTQIQKLPYERIQNNWTFDNRGFVFEENEIYGNVGSYRLAKEYLPEEYSLVKIWTGYHVDNLVWQVEFRPCYTMKK